MKNIISIIIINIIIISNYTTLFIRKWYWQYERTESSISAVQYITSCGSCDSNAILYQLCDVRHPLPTAEVVPVVLVVSPVPVLLLLPAVPVSPTMPAIPAVSVVSAVVAVPFVPAISQMCQLDALFRLWQQYTSWHSCANATPDRNRERYSLTRYSNLSHLFEIKIPIKLEMFKLRTPLFATWVINNADFAIMEKERFYDPWIIAWKVVLLSR